MDGELIWRGEVLPEVKLGPMEIVTFVFGVHVTPSVMVASSGTSEKVEYDPKSTVAGDTVQAASAVPAKQSRQSNAPEMNLAIPVIWHPSVSCFKLNHIIRVKAIIIHCP